MSTTEARLGRGYRALKVVGAVAKAAGKRGGLKAAGKLATKANLALAAVDAVVSVIDACVSYAKLQQAREETKQLVQEIAAAKRELVAEREALLLQVEALERGLALDHRKLALLDKALAETKRLLNHVEKIVSSIEADERADLNKLRPLHFKYERALQAYRKTVALVVDDGAEAAGPKEQEER